MKPDLPMLIRAALITAIIPALVAAHAVAAEPARDKDRAATLKAAESEVARLMAVRQQLEEARKVIVRRVESLGGWRADCMQLTLAAMAGRAEWQTVRWDSEGVARALAERRVSPAVPADERELASLQARAEQDWANAAGQLAAYRKEAPAADDAAFNGRRMALLGALQPLSNNLSAALSSQEALVAALDRRLRELSAALPGARGQLAGLRMLDAPPPPGLPSRERKP